MERFKIKLSVFICIAEGRRKRSAYGKVTQRNNDKHKKGFQKKQFHSNIQSRGKKTEAGLDNWGNQVTRACALWGSVWFYWPGAAPSGAASRALSIHCTVLRIQESRTVLIDAIPDVAVGLESSGSGLSSRHGDLLTLFMWDGLWDQRWIPGYSSIMSVHSSTVDLPQIPIPAALLSLLNYII